MLILVLGQGSLRAQPDTRAAAVELQLQQLQREIAKLKQSLEESRELHRTEQRQLRTIDLAIQQSSRTLRQLEGELETHRAKLAELEDQREAQIGALEARQEELQAQVQAAFRIGRESRVKLILNQDSPARLGRLLAYHDHINQAQARKIRELRVLLGELDQVTEAMDAHLSRLDAMRIEQLATLQTRQLQREERAAVLSGLARQITDRRSRLLELQADRRDLEALLARITSALADIPADLGERLGVPDQRGRLPMPLRGRISRGFGQGRGGGVTWQGWLIDAAPGTEVRNIAYGRVAFADWLRGYGLLMIIDHGQGFMSLYGYNESLLFEPGDWVEPQAVIASVGSNPGGDQGLYFEIRKDGEALDPAGWIKR